MLTSEQEQVFREHMRATNARETCPLCDAGRWTLRIACGGEFLGRVCAQCNHVLLFDWSGYTPAPLITIKSQITLDGKQVAALAWPTIEGLIDDALAISLAQVGTPADLCDGTAIATVFNKAADEIPDATPLRVRLAVD